MKMIPGSKKEEALNEFFSKVLKEAIDNSCAELKKCLGSIFMDVEIEIQDALQSNLSRMQDIRLRLNECLDNQNHIAIQSSLINACYKIETCDQIMKIIEQE
ncbi:hypothetical protein [Ruminococcus sp. HUN007]|uniref:hypothetical protein n=1 Tax=Ruminococcus sp. HUN007 TaxID=1514668 RepID=UPI0005D179A0|nr:hypothetical protein [Ruminococcus sp. HUN007]